MKIVSIEIDKKQIINGKEMQIGEFGQLSTAVGGLQSSFLKDDIVLRIIGGIIVIDKPWLHTKHIDLLSVKRLPKGTKITLEQS
jgi:hypothetical protein